MPATPPWRTGCNDLDKYLLMNEDQRLIAALRREVEQLEQRVVERDKLLTERLEAQTTVAEKLSLQEEEIAVLRKVWLPLRVLVRRRLPNPFPVRPWYLRAMDRVKQKVPQSGPKRVAKSPFFDADWYLNQYPELRSDRLATVNPAQHYFEKGADQGLNPGPGFDTQWYVANNPDVKVTGINPLVHYIVHGMEEGRSPKP